NDSPAESTSPSVRADPGIVGTTTLDVDASFQPVEESMATRLLAPGVDLRIVDVAQSETISAEVYEDLTETRPEADESGEPVDTVSAAEGEMFLIATYSSDDPQWEPRGNEPESQANVLVAGNEVAEVFTTEEATMQRGTIVVSAPAESSPEDIVLEIETDEAFQSLSLLDGTRTSSDVEHIYDASESTVEVTSAEEFEKTYKTWVGDEARIAGSVVDGFLAPWLDPRDGGDGWAGSGQTYLSVAVDWAEVETSTQDHTSIHLVLPDETTVKPENSPVRSNFEDDAVFRVPVETEKVTVVIEPEIE